VRPRSKPLGVRIATPEGLADARHWPTPVRPVVPRHVDRGAQAASLTAQEVRLSGRQPRRSIDVRASEDGQRKAHGKTNGRRCRAAHRCLAAGAAVGGFDRTICPRRVIGRVNDIPHQGRRKPCWLKRVETVQPFRCDGGHAVFVRQRPHDGQRPRASSRRAGQREIDHPQGRQAGGAHPPTPPRARSGGSSDPQTDPSANCTGSSAEVILQSPGACAR